MEECPVDESSESPLDMCEDYDISLSLGSQDSAAALVLLAVKSLLSEIRTIEVPSFQAYAWALQDALETSYESIAAWSSVLGLFLSPLWQLLVVLGRALLPHVLSASTAMWRFQASLPLSTLCAEAAVIVLLVLLILLRRFIARRRYVPRAQRSIRLFRARINRRYLSFTAAVERNFRLSARAFPHVMYWAMVGLIVWVAPESTTKVRDKLWIWVTVTWPALYALYLVLLIRGHKNSAEARRESGGGGRAAEVAAAAAVRSPIASSPGSPTGTAVSRGSVVTPGDVDRVLMYWVVFTVGQCCSTLAEYVPFAGPMLQSMTPPSVRTAAFFVFVWMHLPGPGSGLQVVYAGLEPLVHKYVKDLRTPEGVSGGVLAQMQHVLVFLRVVTAEQAQVIVDNIADSWMLLPTPIFFFTPGFLTNLGCLYAGLVVPALNSVKTLGRRSNRNVLGEWATLANAASGARVRWLTYWVAYGGWWHISFALGGLLRWIPLSRHLELGVLLWLQVPVFHGAGKMLDVGENCLFRWTAASPGSVAAARRQSGG